MGEKLKETVAEFAQDFLGKCPVIILGSGASIAHGIPGMPELKKELLGVNCPEDASLEEKGLWSEFQAKLGTKDLESALEELQLGETLTSFVVELTWDYLAPYDYDVFKKAISNRNIFPLTELFNYLLNSTKKEIDVVTTNYDRLAEYAADVANISHYTGFHYGNIRQRANHKKPRILIGKEPRRTVNVWKVHGSLDWFRDSDGVVLGLPVSNTRPSGVRPVIVTPGIEKYRRTHEEPFVSIKKNADEALRNADAYLCIGYGFNDDHLHPILFERCRENDVPLILLTKTVSKKAKDFLESGNCCDYLAIEEAGSGCRIYSNDYPGGEEIAGERMWELGEFLKLVIP